MVKSSPMLYKTLVIGVIILFIGITIQPGIIADVSFEYDNSELVEITIQFYEVDKTYNHTVMLTQEQAEELEKLVNNFEIKLDNADNNVETETIFKDTVVSLNELGILPKDMSIDKAQRLVTGKEHNPRIVKFLKRWINRNSKSLGSDENALCLIAGETSNTAFFAPIGRILLERFNYLPCFLLEAIFCFIVFGTLIWTIKPLSFGYEIGLGTMVQIAPWHEPRYSPSKGWVNTIGEGGIKKWNGSFYGQLALLKFFLFFVIPSQIYPGVIGFIGIKIGDIFTRSYSYFGSALWVKIGKEHP